jgi:hypothetical protein
MPGSLRQKGERVALGEIMGNSWGGLRSIDAGKGERLGVGAEDVVL